MADVPNIDIIDIPISDLGGVYYPVPNVDAIDVPRLHVLRVSYNALDIAVMFGNSLVFNAAALSSTDVIVLFDRPLASASSTTSRYSITGPSVITVSLVTFIGGNPYLHLTVSGVWAPGVYTLTIVPQTVLDFGSNSNSGLASFVQPVSPPPSGGGGNFNAGFN